jgi:hypothetical protein
LRFRSQDEQQAANLAKSLLDIAEKHGRRTRQRRLSSEAWLQADVRIIGLAERALFDPFLARQWAMARNLRGTLFQRKWLYYRIENGVEIVKLFPRRLTGAKAREWQGGYPVLVNWNLAQLIKE